MLDGRWHEGCPEAPLALATPREHVGLRGSSAAPSPQETQSDPGGGPRGSGASCPVCSQECYQGSRTGVHGI